MRTTTKPNGGTKLGAAFLTALSLFSAPKTSADDILFGGDLRTRVQIIRNRPNNAPNLDFMNTRLRGTVGYETNKNITLNIRGVAETSSVPNLDNRLQDNNHLGYELFIDRAFITFKPINNITIDLGEHNNPFSPTIPQVDQDMPILGATLTTIVAEGVKLQCLYDAGRLLTQDSETSMLGAQLLGEKALENINLTGNIGYQHVIDFDEKYSLSNSKDATFDILSAGLAATTSTPIGQLRGFFEYTYNYRREENADACMAGIKLGEAKEPGTFSCTAQYRYIEKDAMVAGTAVRDSSKTNFDNWIINIQYRLTENIILYILSLNSKHIIPSSVNDKERQHAIEWGAEIKF